jgi:tRNA uridine 5-carboxymethylaminomethyl modification enzyme
MKTDFYDIIVVGAGHAGVEAALAATRMGRRCLLLTMNADQIATMSCNPAVGGLGKSQLAKEVDILGGQMARMADETAIQYRILNAKKGPAVRATRVHCDRHEYRQKMKFFVESQPGLALKQAQVARLLFESGRLQGVETSIGQKFFSRQVVITTGTFMNGKAHIGRQNFSSGRAGEAASIGLSDFLRTLGLNIQRFKTGTVPRVDARTIDFSKTEVQPTETDCVGLSNFTRELRSDLGPAHLTYTNPRTHEIIQESLSESPLYSGIIESRGPRYCPSVEDKIVRFAEKDRHQVFLEREGRQTEEVYVGGLSTSLPVDCQERFLRSIVGLEKVEIIRPGYAIEYDYIDATQLLPSLQVRAVEGLYFAGQVNGTSGYEEAAAQGIMAGINASLASMEKEPFILQRAEAYIGVMIDDLVSKGTSEPYRMMSSRAEWRLVLREDNVDDRLFSKSQSLGLLNKDDSQYIEKKLSRRESLSQSLHKIRIKPLDEAWKKSFESLKIPLPRYPVLASEFVRRPEFEVDWGPQLFGDFFPSEDLNELDWLQVITDLKYAGYVKQAQSQLHQLQRMEQMKIPTSMSFESMSGLPYEAREKLKEFSPKTLADAKRLPGMTPASLQVLAMYVSRETENRACHGA